MKYLPIFYCIILISLTACNSNDKTSTAEAATTEEATEQAQPTEGNKESSKETIPQALNADELKTITTQIRKEFARIESLANDSLLKNKVVKYECPDDPQGGSFTFQFWGDTLLKVNHNFYMGDHYGQESSYYFLKGELIFGFHRSNVWTFAGVEGDTEGEPTTKDDINIQRDYFYHGQLVKQLFKDYTIFSNQKGKNESEVSNQTTGKGVGLTFEGTQIKEFSSKDNLTCEMLNK